MRKIKIGDICDILNGFAFKSNKYVEDGIRIIRIANVQKGYIEDNAPVFYPLYCNEIEKYMLEEGDLLMSLTGNVGRVALLQAEMLPAALNQRVACLRLKSDRLTKRYLFHILNSDFFEQQCIQTSNGVAQKNMSTEWLKEYQIPLYSRNEQLKITDTLDRLRCIIDSRTNEISMLDDLIKSRFVELFGTIHDNRFDFNIATLQDVSTLIKDGTHQTPTYTIDAEQGYKFLSSKDVTTGKIDWSHLKYIPEELHRELYARISPQKGDILLAKNGTTGIAAIVDRNEVFDIYVSLALIRPCGVDTTYLWAAINAAETKQQFDASLKGVGVPNLHLGEIKKARIILPPMELQEQYAAFVEQVDKSKVAVQKSLDETQLLFDSLMQKYFG